MRRSCIVSAKRFARFQSALAALRHPAMSSTKSSGGVPSSAGTSTSEAPVAPELISAAATDDPSSSDDTSGSRGAAISGGPFNTSRVVSAALALGHVAEKMAHMLLRFSAVMDSVTSLLYVLLGIALLFYAYKIYKHLEEWREWVQGRPAYLAERMEVKRERVRARVSDAQEWMSAKKESALSAAAGFQWNTAHRAEADEPSAVTRKSERWRDRAARVLGSAFRNSARAAGEAAAPPTTDLEGEPPTNAEAPKTRFFGLDDALHPAANAEGDTQQQQVGEP